MFKPFNTQFISHKAWVMISRQFLIYFSEFGRPAVARRHCESVAPTVSELNYPVGAFQRNARRVETKRISGDSRSRPGRIVAILD